MAGSGQYQHPVACSDEGESHLLVRSLEYPCTQRLRTRRLLAYLHRYSYQDIYELLRERTHLVKRIKAGQLREAFYYVLRFVSPRGRASAEAKLLMAMSYFADGRTAVAIFLRDWFVSIFRHPLLDKFPCSAAMVDDVLFLRPDLVRASFEWQLVRNKAEEMVHRTPELKNSLRFPRGPKDPCNVVPVGFGYRRSVICNL